jgi:hypothetical protein
MAKGQLRGTKEAKKPKKPKQPTAPALPWGQSTTAGKEAAKKK